MSKMFLVVTMGQGVLLARIEARNVLQCTEKPYHCLQQNITQPQVSIVSRLRNPELVSGSTELPWILALQLMSLTPFCQYLHLQCVDNYTFTAGLSAKPVIVYGKYTRLGPTHTGAQSVEAVVIAHWLLQCFTWWILRLHLFFILTSEAKSWILVRNKHGFGWTMPSCPGSRAWWRKDCQRKLCSQSNECGDSDEQTGLFWWEMKKKNCEPWHCWYLVPDNSSLSRRLFWTLWNVERCPWPYLQMPVPSPHPLRDVSPGIARCPWGILENNWFGSMMSNTE